MALMANQKKRGTQHGKSPADEVARTGRDSGMRTPAKGYTEKGKSPVEDVARSGRSAPHGAGHSRGIGRGNADANGSGDASRLRGDGVGKPLPSA